MWDLHKFKPQVWHIAPQSTNHTFETEMSQKKGFYFNNYFVLEGIILLKLSMESERKKWGDILN